MRNIDTTKILSEAFEIVKNNLELVGLYVLQLVIIAAVGFGLLGINFFTMIRSSMLTVMLKRMILSFTAFIIISMITHIVISATTILIVSSVKKGKKLSVSRALSLGIRKVPLLFVASIIVAIIIGLGFIALIIPGIYLLFRFILYQQACVLNRDLGIKESWNITKGHFWDIFILLVILMIIQIVLIIIPFIGPIINAILISPLSVTVWTLVYLKLRKKK